MLHIYFRKNRQRWFFQFLEPYGNKSNAYRYCWNKMLGREAIIIESDSSLPAELNNREIKKMRKIGVGFYQRRNGKAK